MKYILAAILVATTTAGEAVAEDNMDVARKKLKSLEALNKSRTSEYSDVRCKYKSKNIYEIPASCAATKTGKLFSQVCFVNLECHYLDDPEAGVSTFKSMCQATGVNTCPTATKCFQTPNLVFQSDLQIKIGDSTASQACG